MRGINVMSGRHYDMEQRHIIAKSRLSRFDDFEMWKYIAEMENIMDGKY